MGHLQIPKFLKVAKNTFFRNENAEIDCLDNFVLLFTEAFNFVL